MARHLAPPVEVPTRTEDISVPFGTLGGSIVELANQIEHRERRGSRYDHNVAGDMHESLLAEIYMFKQELGVLSPEAASRLAPYVHSLVPGEVKADGSGAIAELIKQPPDKVVSFMRRHVAVIEQQQKDMQPLFSEAKDIFVNGILSGIKDGWVSPNARHLKSSALNTELEVGDWWSTKKERVVQGYHSRGTNTVTVSQGLGRTRQERNADFAKHGAGTIIHEMVHKEIDPSLPSAVTGNDWMYEAFAEHLTLSLLHGHPTVLDPGLRANDSGVYYYRRALVSEIMDGLPPELWTRAMTSLNPLGEEWEQLDDALYLKYGTRNVLKRVTANVQYHFESAGSAEQESTGLAGEYAAYLTILDLRADPVRVTGQINKQPRHSGVAAAAGMNR